MKKYTSLHHTKKHHGDLMSVPVWAESINECVFCTDGVRRDSLAFLLDLTAKYIHTSKADRGLPETGQYRVRLLDNDKHNKLHNKYLGFNGSSFAVTDAKHAIVFSKEEVEIISKNVIDFWLFDWNALEPATKLD